MESKQTKFTNPTELFNPNPFGFSHSISIASPFKICFVAGQSGGKGANHILSDDFRTQVQDALDNVKTVLQSHTMTMNDIVKITLLIVDHNEEKLKIWSEEAKKTWNHSFLPTSTLIPVSRLALPDMLFEIDVIATKTE